MKSVSQKELADAFVIRITDEGSAEQARLLKISLILALQSEGKDGKDGAE